MSLGAASHKVLEEMAGRAVSYLNAIFLGSHGQDQVGMRTSQEMRTIAEALDALSEGKLPQLGDLLMQRFKALELSVSDKGWTLAAQVDITGKPTGLTNETEKMLAARSALLTQKINDAKKRLGGAGH